VIANYVLASSAIRSSSYKARWQCQHVAHVIGIDLMAMKAAAANRAPRGTKVLMQAFFVAADEIAEAARPAVIKAALAAIRDQLKADREKAAAAKAKAAGKTPVKAGAKKAAPETVAAKKAAPKAASKVAAKAPAKAKARKAPAKRAQKAAAEPTTPTPRESQVEETTEISAASASAESED